MKFVSLEKWIERVQDAGSIPAASTELVLEHGGDQAIDWAMSIEVDSTVGDDRKSSKTQ